MPFPNVWAVWISFCHTFRIFGDVAYCGESNLRFNFNQPFQTRSPVRKCG